MRERLGVLAAWSSRMTALIFGGASNVVPERGIHPPSRMSASSDCGVPTGVGVRRRAAL